MDKVLIVSAHADDEVLGVGGTIIQHVKRGDDVTVVIVADRLPHQTAHDEQKHAQEARSLLGYNDLKFLHLRDEQLDFKLSIVIKPLEEVYNMVQPTIVYTHHRGDNNQDHRAVFDATAVICRPKWKPPRQLFCYETISSTDQSSSFSACTYLPNYYKIMAKEEIDRKIEAMQLYEHQIEEWPLPRSPETIEAYARYRGTQCGTKYAEALMLLREIN
jgi:LmbE family N-acetylglucosaminyl deacetylase